MTTSRSSTSKTSSSPVASRVTRSFGKGAGLLVIEAIPPWSCAPERSADGMAQRRRLDCGSLDTPSRESRLDPESAGRIRAPAVDGAGRRRVLAAGASAAVAATLLVHVRPAQATPEELAAAIRAFAAGAPVRAGRVRLDVAPLVDNGNTVPITVGVADSPMTAADHVRAIAVFNERNPQREVAVFTLGPRAGRASVQTRIRLATSQQLVAVAKMSDGSCWSHSVDVVVTLAACIES